MRLYSLRKKAIPAVIPNEVRNPSVLNAKNKERFLAALGMTDRELFSASSLASGTQDNEFPHTLSNLCKITMPRLEWATWGEFSNRPGPDSLGPCMAWRALWRFAIDPHRGMTDTEQPCQLSEDLAARRRQP